MSSDSVFNKVIHLVGKLNIFCHSILAYFHIAVMIALDTSSLLFFVLLRERGFNVLGAHGISSAEDASCPVMTRYFLRMLHFWQ